ncbi:MAG TPA: helicase, partial [Sulfurovum sp.]|nr:helicase [Sulfurovum sp.]
MAKKKKKQSIKINNKVKELMNGEAFDEGIKYLSDDILVELTMLLDLKVPMLVKKEMVRALRQVWSEGNVHLRMHIVNYLEQMNLKKVHLDETDKVSYIVSLLAKHEHNKEEEQQILSAFIDTKFNKISEEKILNKLNYIRQQRLMNIWEKKVEVEFNTLSQMEFYHSYEFAMNEETFYKSLLTTSSSIENNLLINGDEAYIKQELEALKLSAIAQ